MAHPVHRNEPRGNLEGGGQNAELLAAKPQTEFHMTNEQSEPEERQILGRRGYKWP